MSIKEFNKKQYEIFKEAMKYDPLYVCNEWESEHFIWFSCRVITTEHSVLYKINKTDYLVTVDTVF